MKTACKTQCRECPFRRNAVPGYLGDYTAATVFYTIWRNNPFFCHSKINYEEDGWLEKAMHNGKLCLGGLAFANKIRAPKNAESYKDEGSDAEVIKARATIETRNDIDCMGAKEFLTHHGHSL